MRLVVAMLCNRAAVNNGVLDIIGGCPEWYSIARVPGTLNLTVAAVVEVEQSDLGRTVQLGYEMLDRDGEISGNDAEGLMPIAERTPTPGAPLYEPAVVSLSLQVRQLGPHRLLIRLENGDDTTLHFGVVPG